MARAIGARAGGAGGGGGSQRVVRVGGRDSRSRALAAERDEGGRAVFGLVEQLGVDEGAERINVVHVQEVGEGSRLNLDDDLIP